MRTKFTTTTWLKQHVVLWFSIAVTATDWSIQSKWNTTGKNLIENFLLFHENHVILFILSSIFIYLFILQWRNGKDRLPKKIWPRALIITTSWSGASLTKFYLSKICDKFFCDRQTEGCQVFIKQEKKKSNQYFYLLLCHLIQSSV